MLSDLRVLELSAPETMLAGQTLGDLGADVIVVEPPAGAAGRRLEPFVDEVPGLERSLTWHAFNRNKRGMTLDLGSADGRALLADLAERADVVIGAAGPDADPLEIVAVAAERNPRLVRCAIRPFARSGPKSNYASSDLILVAASGSLGMSGDPDRAPIPFPVPQAMLEASGEAVIGVLAALVARERTGEGQQVEISNRLAALLPGFGQAMVIPSGNQEPTRSGGTLSLAGVQIPSTFVCADGYVVVSIAFGPAFGPMTGRLAEWLAEEGTVPAETAAVDWVAFGLGLMTGAAEPEPLRSLVEGVEVLCRRLSKEELAAAARERGLLVAPAMDMADLYRSLQYRERGLWAELEIGTTGRTVEAPARFGHFSDYRIEVRRPAPGLSQHTVELLRDELRLSPTEIQSLYIHGVF